MMTDWEICERDRKIYGEYLLSLELRQKIVCAKHGITHSRYKQIIAKQKRLHELKNVVVAK